MAVASSSPLALMPAARLCQAALSDSDAVRLSWGPMKIVFIALLQHGPAERCRGGARALAGEPCLPESARSTDWSDPSRFPAEMGAERRGEPTPAPDATVYRGAFGWCLAHAAPPPHKSMHRIQYWRAVSCPRLLGACRKTLRACVRACAKSLRVRSVPKVCCIQQSSTKKDAVPGRCSEPKIVCGSVGALHTPGARYIRLSHALPRCLRTNISRATARAKLQQITT